MEFVRKWNEESNENQEVYEDKKWSRSNSTKDVDQDLSVERGSSAKEVNNNKIKDKLNKFEHLKDEGESESKKKEKRLLIPVVEKDGLKGKLQMFEKEIREQEVSKKEGSTLHTPKPKREVSNY